VQGVGIDVPYLTEPHVFADVRELVARGDDGHRRLPVYVHRVMVERGEDTYLGRGQAVAPVENGVAHPDALPGEPVILEACGFAKYPDVTRLFLGVLDLDDSIRSPRYGGTGHDPYRRSWRDLFALSRCTRLHLSDDLKPGRVVPRRAERVRGDYGVAVHA